MKTRQIRLALLLLCSFLSVSVVAAPGDHIGIVMAVQGDCSATTAKKISRKLVLKSKIMQNDTITTGAGSKIQIMFNDDSIISQGEHSEMTIDEYVYTPKAPKKMKSSFKLVKGVFRTITGKITEINPDRFKVKTRMATIGIRGCEVGCRIRKDGLDVLVLGLPKDHEIVISEIAKDMRGVGLNTLKPGATLRIAKVGMLVRLRQGFDPVRRNISKIENNMIIRDSTPEGAVAPPEKQDGQDDGSDGADNGQGGDGAPDGGEGKNDDSAEPPIAGNGPGDNDRDDGLPEEPPDGPPSGDKPPDGPLAGDDLPDKPPLDTEPVDGMPLGDELPDGPVVDGGMPPDGALPDKPLIDGVDPDPLEGGLGFEDIGMIDGVGGDLTGDDGFTRPDPPPPLPLAESEEGDFFNDQTGLINPEQLPPPSTNPDGGGDPDLNPLPPLPPIPPTDPDPDPDPIPNPDPTPDPNVDPTPGLVAVLTEGGGTDWQWGIWTEDGIADSLYFEAKDESLKIINTQTEAKFSDLVSQSQLYSLSGVGYSAAIIDNPSARELVEGTCDILLQVGDNTTPWWDGTFSLGSGDTTLDFAISGDIQDDGTMTGTPYSYNMHLRGKHYPSSDIINSHVEGYLLGPGGGAKPTGTFGHYNFGHSDGTTVDGGFGADLSDAF